MTIDIDNRIGSRELYGPLAGFTTARINMTRLQAGDVAWVGNGPEGIPVTVGVERKRIRDLLSSIDSGRLSGTQLPSMSKHFTYGYLLVEGLWRPDDDGMLCMFKGKTKRWQPVVLGGRRYLARAVYKYLNTLASICGVIPWRTGDIYESAEWIASVYGWWQEPWESHGSHRVKTKQRAMLRINAASSTTMAKMLQELDGVGLNRAEAVARAYPTMRELVENARVDDLAKIPYGKRRDGAVLHIGKGTARKIIKQIMEGAK